VLKTAGESFEGQYQGRRAGAAIACARRHLRGSEGGHANDYNGPDFDTKNVAFSIVLSRNLAPMYTPWPE
jgi:hypothetical protein